LRLAAILTLVLAAFLFVIQTAQAKSKQFADSSALAMPPIYNLSGTAKSHLLGTYHESSTTLDGTTYSAYCNTTATSVDCQEGTGLIHWIDTTDGKHIQYGCEICLPVDLDHSDGAFGFALVPLSDAPLPFNVKEGTLIHFRLRSVIVTLLGIAGSVENYLCVPLLNLPSFPDGKARAAYAKHHSMEACIRY
jgi:hypothetical protein